MNAGRSVESPERLTEAVRSDVCMYIHTWLGSKPQILFDLDCGWMLSLQHRRVRAAHPERKVDKEHPCATLV